LTPLAIVKFADDTYLLRFIVPTISEDLEGTHCMQCWALLNDLKLLTNQGKCCSGHDLVLSLYLCRRLNVLTLWLF